MVVRVYLGSVLNPVDSRRYSFLPSGGLAVSEDGRILSVGTETAVEAEFPGADVSRFEDALIIPGLVDTHVHLPQYEAVATESSGLLEWLDRDIFPLEAAFEDVRKARSVATRFFHDLAKNGTTTSSVFVTIHEDATRVAFEEAEKAGLRVLIGKVMMDRNCPPELREETTDSLKQSERLCAEWHGAAGGRLRYSFTPRFAVTCSPQLLRESAQLAARYNAHIQTHLAESSDEIRLVKELFPKSRSYTEVYSALGMLRRGSVFAHAIYINDEEVALLATSGSGVAHCPASNLFLQSGFMDVDRLLRNDIDVGLGSDIAGGPEISVFRAMAFAGYSSKALLISRMFDRTGLSVVDARVTFFLATLGGARALGLGDEVGSLSKGKFADFLVIKPQEIDPLHRSPSEMSPDRLLSLLMYRGDDRVVMEAYVAGMKVNQPLE